MKEDTKVYVKEFAKELSNLVKLSMNEACDAYEEFVENSLKEKKHITSYEKFLKSIPSQIKSVTKWLRTEHYSTFLGKDTFVEFDMRWNTEFNKVELSNINVDVPPLFKSLLQTDDYELVDDTMLEEYLKNIKYGPYCQLLNQMHCFIEVGKSNQDVYPEFNWQEMVLNKAEDAIVEGKI